MSLRIKKPGTAVPGWLVPARRKGGHWLEGDASFPAGRLRNRACRTNLERAYIIYPKVFLVKSSKISAGTP